MLGSAFLAKRITMPLHELVEGTIRISNGDFSHRIRLASRDEVGDLARSFNEMTDRLLEARECMEAANRKLVQAEKLASIGRLAATIAHEIRNPLTSVKLNIQRIAESEHFDEIEREHLSLCQQGIGQIEKFIKDLLDFTRASELVRERFPIEQVIEESLKMLKGCFEQKKVTVEKAYAPGLPPANVDGDKMRQVFLNILRNAFEAIDNGGRISISLALAKESGGPEIPCQDLRQRGRHPGEGLGDDLRALFHDQGLRHRPGPCQRAEDRRAAQRIHQSRQETGERERLRRHSPL
jgi:signal transduction histidine kinase